MEKLKHFEKTINTVKRFYLPFSLIVALFLIISSITVLNFNQEIVKILFKIIYTLTFGIFTCTLFKILHEKFFCRKINKPIFDIISLLISAILYLPLHFYENNIFVNLALFGVVISEIIFIFYFSGSESMSETFLHFLKNLIFSFFICLIIFAGISICVSAFTILIYDFKDSYKIYHILGEFVGIILFGLMFLSSILKSGQKVIIPYIFKIIIEKFILPIYVLLLFILYTYLSKILFTLDFPSGQINRFVSLSSLLFIFLSFSLNQYKNENKTINLFLKFSGLVILPTIIMQFIAIYIRVSSYGLTSFRYVSIIFNIFVVIFAIMTLLWHEKSLKYSLGIFATFVLLVTLTPLNIIDIPVRAQSNKLKRLLLNNNILINGSIIPNDNISQEEQTKILGSYRYIRNKFEITNCKPDFLNKGLIEKQEKEIFGFD